MKNDISLDKGFIKGYPLGANISLLNVMYIRAKKDPETGKWGNDYLYIIYKDLDTGEKHVQEIKSPKYRYYMVNQGVPVSYNRLFIEKHNVHPVECNYSDLRISVAEQTGNLDWYYDKLKSGNYKATEELFTLPSVFGADINIEDFYRFEFNKLYKNDSYTPTKLYFDIETDIKDMKGDFPEPGECPINVITIIDGFNYKIYTLILMNYSNPLIEEFAKNNSQNEKDIKDFVRERVGGWKNEIRFGLDKFTYKMVYFDEEIELIKSTFKLINYIKPDYALAWNIAFDLPYIIQRIYNLGYNPADIICDPAFSQKDCYYFIDHADKFEERGDYAQVSCMTIYLDQLITFASRRKGQRQISSFKLDNVGSIIAGVNKLDYSHITNSIAALPYLDFHTFIFYNIMDTIVQLCIEHRVNDIDFVHNKALSTNTRISKVHRQTTYLVNRGIQDFYDMGYILGPNINKKNHKEGFAGAFVADPLLVSDKPKIKIDGTPINVLKNLNDFDYKALYPSIIDQNNMSPNTQHGKILIKEQLDSKENRFNNAYFDRGVWFMEDLNSTDYLDFCERHLRMPSYLKMYHAIKYYFRNISSYMVNLRYTDPVNGKRLMYDVIEEPKKKKRLMYELVDKTKDKIMCVIQDKFPSK